jgi:molybdopterin-guanine dinucleotide biosynthesis protein A
MSTQAASGYVLAGGRSRRMGISKAGLPWRGITLGTWVAGEVAAVTGSVTIAGASWPGYRSIPDLVPNFGPVSGIAACLADTPFEWSLIVACDMPFANREWLRFLLDSVAGDALVPRTPDGRLHPLCAVWNRSALDRLAGAMQNGVHRVQDVLQFFDCRTVAVDNPAIVTNVNTPDEWACVQE